MIKQIFKKIVFSFFILNLIDYVSSNRTRDFSYRVIETELPEGWTPLVCRQSSEFYQLKQIVIFGPEILYYFDTFVARTTKPRLYPSDDSNYFLEYSGSVINHFPYSTNKIPRPSIIDYSDIIGQLEVIYSDGNVPKIIRRFWGRYASEQMQKIVDVFNLKFGKTSLGAVNREDRFSTYNLKEKDFDWGFNRYDFDKYFEVHYYKNKIHFILYDKDIRQKFGETIVNVDYKVTNALYYDSSYPRFEFEYFNGILIEHDANNHIHVTNYTFRFLKNKLLIENAHHVEMDYEEFFGCRFYNPDKEQKEEQIKGIYFNKPKSLWYFFINNYYYTQKDPYPISNNFFRYPETFVYSSKKDQTVKFDPDDNFDWERISYKYVKEVDGELFLTFNNRQTYKVDFRNVSNRETGQEREEMFATKSPKLVHKCIKTILISEDKKAFCFDEEYYWLISLDGFETTIDNAKKLTIRSLFKDPSIPFKYFENIYDEPERIKFIVNYVDADKKKKVLFLTRYNYYKFDRSDFRTYKLDSEENYALKLNIQQQTQVQKQACCLFTFKCSALKNGQNVKSDPKIKGIDKSVNKVFEPETYPDELEEDSFSTEETKELVSNHKRVWPSNDFERTLEPDEILWPENENNPIYDDNILDNDFNEEPKTKTKSSTWSLVLILLGTLFLIVLFVGFLVAIKLKGNKTRGINSEINLTNKSTDLDKTPNELSKLKITESMKSLRSNDQQSKNDSVLSNGSKSDLSKTSVSSQLNSAPKVQFDPDQDSNKPKIQNYQEESTKKKEKDYD